MFNQALDRLTKANDWPALIPACLLGLVIGTACFILSPASVFALLLGLAVGLLVLKRPEIGLLGILVATSTIIAEARLPRIPGFYITDIALIILFALIAVRLLAEREFKFVTTPLDAPLVAFYGVALLSTMLGLLRGVVTRNLAVTETRYLTYYLVFFIVTHLIRKASQVRLLVQGLIALGVFVAMAVIMQYTLGQSVNLLPGRVEMLVTEGEVHSDITRITGFAGEAMILANFILCLVLLIIAASPSGELLGLVLVGILGIALIITFNRNFWIGAALAGGLLAYLGDREVKARMAKWLLFATVLLAILLSLLTIQPDSKASALAGATFERVASLFKSETIEPEETSTLRWRDFEYNYTIPQILANPVLGLGLGAHYRPYLESFDHANFDGRGYTHNAHVWIMVKTGLLGYLCFAWLSVRFLQRSFSQWRSIRVPFMQGTLVGFALTYVAVLIGSLVNPMLMQWYWIPIIGLMMGTNEVIIRLNNQPAAPIGHSQLWNHHFWSSRQAQQENR